MPWPCFWVDEQPEVQLSLRRFSDADGGCPGGYHNASVPVGTGVADRDAAGYHKSVRTARARADVDEQWRDDERWPTTCEACPYEFVDTDSWQVARNRIFRRGDTGETWTERTLPPGAMLDGFWHPQKGPDGIALVVVLPPATEDSRGHWWHVDGPSRNNGAPGPGWTRTGDPKATPPTVTAAPSILTDTYHGFLQSGVLTDDLDHR